ncbi:MAG: hypothetical protein IT204_14490 [Fimbriimonadaceae bacterium]|nr:hypothetical protein [Fimbriimonadaceae bacterium]
MDAVVAALATVRASLTPTALAAQQAACVALPLAARRAQWEQFLNDQAAPLARALHDAAAAATGPDWSEHDFDSYHWERWRRHEWSVVTPFALLTVATSPIVPLAVAERLLALPERPAGDRRPAAELPRGRCYRRAWLTQQRPLTLVAELAVRFAAAGGSGLLVPLQVRLRQLAAPERAAVELRLAVLQGATAELPELGRRVLDAAARDELGRRAPLLQRILDDHQAWPDGTQVRLLAAARGIAELASPHLASNPLGAATAALAAARGAEVEDLVVLVERAGDLRLQGWAAWEALLASVAAALREMAGAFGLPAVRQAVERLAPYSYSFPDLPARLLLAGADGLRSPERSALAHEALHAARQLAPSAAAARIEVQAARWLAEAGAEGGYTELRTTAQRLVGQGAGRWAAPALREAAAALADLDRGDGEGLATALTAADALRDPAARWQAYLTLASAAKVSPEIARQAAERARRAARRWLLRSPPLDEFEPLLTALVARLPGGPQHPLAARLVRLATAAGDDPLGGRASYAAWAGLPALAAEPDALHAVAASLATLGETWWRLPLLALLGDATWRWLQHCRDQLDGSLAAGVEPGAAATPLDRPD